VDLEVTDGRSKLARRRPGLSCAR